MSATGTRTSPRSQYAEQALLGAILADPERALPLVRELRPDHFYWRGHARIFEAILDLSGPRGLTPDLVTVTDSLRACGRLDEVGGVAYLSELLSKTTTTAGIPAHAELIRSKAGLRAVIDAGHEIAELGYDEEAPLAEVRRRVERVIERIDRVVPGGDQDLVALGDPGELSELAGSIENERLSLPGISSGIEELDSLLDGGFATPGFYFVYGRPKTFKTGTGINVARYVAGILKIPVFYCSMEMSRLALRRRLLQAEGGWTRTQLRLSREHEPELASRVSETLSTIQDLPIYFYARRTGSRSLSRILAAAERAVVERGCRLIMIENLDRIGSDQRYDKKHEALETISNILADWPQELNELGHRVALVLFGQANREARLSRDGFPLLEQIAGTDQISRDCDGAIALASPARSGDAAHKGEIGFKVVAGREIPEGEVAWVPVDPPRMRVGAWAKPAPFKEAYAN